MAVLSSRSVSRGTVRLIGLLVGVVALLVILASATLIDRRPPAVERISLSRTATDGLALTHAALDITFSESVQRRSAEIRFRLDPVVAGSFSWDGDRTLIFTPDDRFPVATDFRLWLDGGVADLAGNVSTGPSSTFTFRTVDLPALVSSEPADEATSVPLEAPLSLTFDRLMDTELTQAAVRLEPAAAVQTAWRGQTLLVTPERPLRAGTRYRLTVSAEAADTDGNQLGRAISLDFTTLATGLAPRTVIPADGSAGAPLSGPIALVFDGGVDPDSIADSIRLTPAASGRLTVQTPVTDTGEEAEGILLVFEPDSPLAPHTTYTVELRPGIVRSAGSELAAEGRTWSFTTGSGPELPQNQILFLSDRGGVRNLWAMNPDGTNARQLTSEMAPVTAYDVSADGRLIVYAAGGRVVRFSLPDGSATVLTTQSEAEYAPRLLPDGSGLIVGRRARETGRDLGYWLLSLLGEGVADRQLLVDGAPPLGSSAGSALPDEAGRPSPWAALAGISPDSRTALLPRADGSLVRVRLADGLVSPTGLSGALGPIAWSSLRGGFVVTATNTSDGSEGCWLVLRAGSVVSGPDIAGWPAVGPSGAVAGLSPVLEGHLIYLALPGGSPVLLTGDELLDREPSFSPGGDELVFSRMDPASTDGSAGIWRVAIDASGLRQLTPAGSDPRWLP